MQHPTPERLAELAESVPVGAEVNHLIVCIACASEVERFRALGGMAAALRAQEPEPLTNWSSLAAQLRAEGLIRDETTSRGRASISRLLLRIAAGLLIFLGGVLAERAMAGSTESVTAAGTNGGEMMIRDASEAREMLMRAQREYQVAAAYLASYAGAGEAVDADLIRTRLAALDAVAGVVREAIDEAPFDPVINQYYISTLEARQATLHQLASALPAGTQLSRF
jgi:hypothetical protein